MNRRHIGSWWPRPQAHGSRTRLARGSGDNGVDEPARTKAVKSLVGYRNMDSRRDSR